MGGIFGRVAYAAVLLGVLAAATWISFSRFVLGKSLRVPDLTSLSVEEAVARGAEQGLLVVPDAAQQAFDDRIPVHRIRGQVPAPDTAVKAGQRVRVFLSLGPRTIRVPDVTGLTPRTSALAFSKAGLRQGAVAAARLAAPAGIVSQGLAPGTTAAPDAAVDVLVNRGPIDAAWVMPDLIGRDFDKVRTAFEARGFKLGGVKSQAYEGAAAGTILRQFPQSGFPVTLRDTLSFVVAASEGQTP